jgi:integrase
MFELPPTVYDTLAQRLKPQSIKRYTGWLNKLVFKGDDYNVKTLVDFHKNIPTDIKARNDYTSLLAAIIAVLRAEGKDTSIYEKLKANHSTTYYKEPTVADKENQISVKDVFKLRDELKQSYEQKPTLVKALHLLYLSFICEIPPLRSEDYLNTSFINQEGVNFLNTETNQLLIKGGKSLNSKRNIKLPKKLMDTINEIRERFAIDWLFPQVKNVDKPMTTSGFNKFLGRLFSKKISTSRIRQIFVSHWKDNELSKEERVVNAEQMGHTYNTSESNYTKFSETIHKKDEVIKKQKRQIAVLKARLKKAEANAK